MPDPNVVVGALIASVMLLAVNMYLAQRESRRWWTVAVNGVAIALLLATIEIMSRFPLPLTGPGI